MRSLSLLAAAAVLFVPAFAHAGQAPGAAGSHAGKGCCELYPTATGPLSISVEDGQPDLLQLAMTYGELTQQGVLMDAGSRDRLQVASTGLQTSVVIPAGEVQAFFEQTLAANGFFLDVIHATAPRIVEVGDARGAHATLRSRARHITAEKVAHFAKHPATLVTAAVELPNSDVRQLSTSLRALMTDNRTQSIIAAGDSRTLIVTDFGTNLASLVALLKLVDSTSAVQEPQKLGVSVFALEHASALKLRIILNGVLRPAPHRGADGENRTRGVDEPRIVADERTNSLVVAAMPDDMATIQALIAQLDKAQ